MNDEHDTQVEPIELGVASLATKGLPGGQREHGIVALPAAGIDPE